MNLGENFSMRRMENREQKFRVSRPLVETKSTNIIKLYISHNSHYHWVLNIPFYWMKCFSRLLKSWILDSKRFSYAKHIFSHEFFPNIKLQMSVRVHVHAHTHTWLWVYVYDACCEAANSHSFRMRCFHLLSQFQSAWGLK